MTSIDPPAFIIVSALLGSLCMIVLEILRRSLPESIRGVGLWTGACAASIMSAVLLLLGVSRAIPLLYGLGNLSLILALMLMHTGLRHFLGRAPWYRSLGATLLVAALGLGWFLLVRPDFSARLMINASISMVLYAAMFREMHRIETRNAAVVFTSCVALGMSAVCLVRLVTVMLDVDQARFAFDPSLLQRLFLSANAAAILSLTMGFILMVGQRLQATLENMAARDSQTGTYARGAFCDLLDKEILRARRSGEALSLMIIDVDNFKSINDNYGHTTGDLVIANFVAVVNATLRQYDVFGRYGGDEFAVALPQTSAAEAGAVAERIRTACAAASMGGMPRYTVSIGICTTIAGHESLQELIIRADTALYEAKANGKDCVATAGLDAHRLPHRTPRHAAAPA